MNCMSDLVWLSCMALNVTIIVLLFLLHDIPPKHLTVCPSVTVFSALLITAQPNQMYWNSFSEGQFNLHEGYFACISIPVSHTLTVIYSCICFKSGRCTLLWNYQSRRRFFSVSFRKGNVIFVPLKFCFKCNHTLKWHYVWI